MLIYVDVCMRGRMYGRVHRRGTRVSASAYMCVCRHVCTYTCVYVRHVRVYTYIYVGMCDTMCMCVWEGACARSGRAHE
jgi:hypothetical protein